VGEIIADLTPGLPTNLTVRGYPENIQTGDTAARFSAAYRFPLVEVSQGSEGIFPVYTRQLFGEVFYDGGRTWDRAGAGDDLEWIQSFGTEVNLSVKVLRYIQFAPGVGVAYVPDNDRKYRDEDEFVAYFSLKAWINF
jgi:hypothetical protein